MKTTTWLILACVYLSEPTVHAAIGDRLSKLLPNDRYLLNMFGYSVAISGNTAIVGSPGDRVKGEASGSAYLFDVTTNEQQSKLVPNNVRRGDQFGTAVDISGNIAIAGAPRYSSPLPGSAYLYDVNTGTQLAELTAEDGERNEAFGDSVAIDGNTAIVGARMDDDLGELSGSAYLFDVVTGKQIAKLLAGDGKEDDFFGRAVAISGNTALVGAAGYNDARGRAYLFDARTGSQISELVPSDIDQFNEFGFSVAIEGNRAIVGAVLEGDGAAYVFDTNTGAQLNKLVPSDGALGTNIGWSVSIDEDIAIVGVRFNGELPSVTEVAYLFDVTSGQQLAKLTVNEGGRRADFGYPVDISGSTSIVGVYLDNGDESGSAYLYSTIPEPSTLYLATLAAANLLRRRRPVALIRSYRFYRL